MQSKKASDLTTLPFPGQYENRIIVDVYQVIGAEQAGDLLDYAQALRKAQLELRHCEQWSQPYHWPRLCSLEESSFM